MMLNFDSDPSIALIIKAADRLGTSKKTSNVEVYQKLVAYNGRFPCDAGEKKYLGVQLLLYMHMYGTVRFACA